MTVQANPYASYDLYVPKAWHDSYRRYTSVQQSEGGDLDGAPFPRMIDFWWAALGIGVRDQRRAAIGEARTKIADGAILNSDPWRITHLGLIALADEGEAVLDRPADVVRIASEYAAAGTERLVEIMSPHPRPMKPLLTELRRLLGE
jgi:hypothetical protein